MILYVCVHSNVTLTAVLLRNCYVFSLFTWMTWEMFCSCQYESCLCVVVAYLCFLLSVRQGEEIGQPQMSRFDKVRNRWSCHWMKGGIECWGLFKRLLNWKKQDMSIEMLMWLYLTFLHLLASSPLSHLSFLCLCLSVCLSVSLSLSLSLPSPPPPSPPSFFSFSVIFFPSWPIFFYYYPSLLFLFFWKKANLRG